jgi:hypothetical protein
MLNKLPAYDILHFITVMIFMPNLGEPLVTTQCRVLKFPMEMKAKTCGEQKQIWMYWIIIRGKPTWGGISA